MNYNQENLSDEQVNSYQQQIEALRKQLEAERREKEAVAVTVATLIERNESLQSDIIEVKEQATKEMADLEAKHQEKCQECQEKEMLVQEVAKLKEINKSLQTEIIEVKEQAIKETTELKEKHKEVIKEMRLQLNKANSQVKSLIYEKEIMEGKNENLSKELIQVKEQKESLLQEQEELVKKYNEAKKEIGKHAHEICQARIREISSSNLAKEQFVFILAQNDKRINDWSVYKQERNRELELMKIELEELFAMTTTKLSKFSFSKNKSTRTNLFECVAERVKRLLLGELDY